MLRPVRLRSSLRLAPSSGAGEATSMCVDSVRFWSMLAIISVHSLVAWDVSDTEELTQNLQMALLQIAKFGTIGFYFIAGFLLGQRLENDSASCYFRRRLQKVGAPWALWTSLFVLLPFTKRIVLLPVSTRSASVLALQLWHRVLDVLFFSPYWFVPNFLFALACLLLCRRYRDNWYFGVALLCSSLFYGVNIYGHWIPAGHTTAAGGFVFYLWLGQWASRHGSTTFGFLKRTKVWKLIIALVVTGSAALAEAHFLQKHGLRDATNTLRISNQLFSLLVVAALLKRPRATCPSFLDVRASTFGLYLIHPVLGLALHRLLEDVHARPFGTGPGAYLSLWAVVFLVHYGGSLILTQALVRRPRLAWMVGQHTGPPTVDTLLPPVRSAIWVRWIDIHEESAYSTNSDHRRAKGHASQ